MRLHEYARLMLAEDATAHAVKRVLVYEALKACNNNQTKAAEKLDMSRDQLRYFMNKVEKEDALAKRTMDQCSPGPVIGACSPTLPSPPSIPQE